MLGMVSNYWNFLHMKLKRGKKTHRLTHTKNSKMVKMEESSYRKHKIRKITPTAATLNIFNKKECVFCSNTDQDNSVSEA